MAAIYSGIHLKLKSPHTPWEDKLKLARFAWISTQCLLPNKEQVLLDWCTHALTGWYSQKVEFSHHVLEGLWCYLDDLLHSKKLHSLPKQGKTISLRLNMAQLLIERLHEFVQAASKSPALNSCILSVCQGLLSSPALSSVFTTKYELMVDLLAKVCSLSCRELKQPVVAEPVIDECITNQGDIMIECLQILPGRNLDSSKIERTSESPPHRTEFKTNKSHPNSKKNLPSTNLFDVLLQALSCYLSVQRQQANPNRVFTMVTNQLIQELVLLRHLLTSGEFASFPTHLRVCPQLCREIRVKIDSILKTALFPSEHSIPYKDELLPSEDSGKRGPGGAKVHLKPVTTILSKLSTRGYCEQSLHYAVKSTTLSLLFKFFLESYGRGRGESEEEHRMLCFYFLTRLVSVLDISLDGQLSGNQSSPLLSCEAAPLDSPSSPESWSLALLTVESLLNQALSADIYNVAADRIRHGEVQFSFYRSIGEMLFNQSQPSIPAWYRCLKVLLNLNHLILEPDLDQLLSSAWVNSECMETRVQRARQHVVSSLLQIYSKLRQLPRLFSELLSVICQPALDQLRPPLLSEGISCSLRTCLLDTPPSQVLEICSSVLESIGRYILPDLLKEERAIKDMNIGGERDDKETKVDQERDDASLKLFSLSQLLHVVLFNLRTLDNASPLPVVRQSRSTMEKMQQIVKELICVSPLKKKAVESNVSLVQKTPRKRKKNLDHRAPERISESNMGPLWEQKTQEAALLLQYTGVEVNTLFHIHCSKYTPLDSEKAAATEAEIPVLANIESCTGLQPSCSPMSCLLLKLLTLQQMKKVLLDTPLLSEPSVAAHLNKAARFILDQPEFKVSLDGEQVWDRQMGSVNASSYPVAHWYVITSNLPLIAPHLGGEDVGCIADTFVSSLLSQDTGGGKDCPPGCLTTSIISSQLLQSSVLAELPSLFSATVHSLNQRIVALLKAACLPNVHLKLLSFLEEGYSSLNKDSSLPQSTLVEKETVVQDVLASSRTGSVAVLMTDVQMKELVNLLEILMHLNPDGMNSEDLSSVFLLLLFILSSTSTADPPESRDDAAFLVKLLRILTCLLEGRNFQSVLKLIHGGTLLQAVASSLFCLIHNGRFQSTCSSDWLDLIKAVQGFITCLVQLIIIRNSSIRLNLDQFTNYLSGKEAASRQTMTPNSAALDKADVGASILTTHLLLALLTSFSQAMASNLGRSKPVDQTLAQMLTRMAASLGPAVESVLRPQTGGQSLNQLTSVITPAFVVEVVMVMLRCELSSLSVEEGNTLANIKPRHMNLYQDFCKQILKEICSAKRPMDFLVYSLHFLSAFYEALRTTRGETEVEQGEEMKAGKEVDELYMQILQTVHRLLTASWLPSNDICELEPPVQELLCHLVEKSTAGQFNLLLMMIREGLNSGLLRAENYKEVLFAVTIIKLLSSCQLPEPCSKALWLLAPQIISALMFFTRLSSQDPSLTLQLTVPMVVAVTSLLRQGEGHITNPHHVILVLGALQSVPLDHLTPSVYQSVFLAVHEALFAIIQCHPQVMLKAAPSFLNVFHRLLASIMQEGRQKGESDTGTDGDVYLQCSRLVERMYSHVAAAPKSFTTLSAFMVAQYVTELQKVTLRADVKLHLTEGIYRILDLCTEQDIKFLTAGLQMGVREVFSELYSSYTLYHKAQRQGEDKYTV